jgi:hypothetical protein
MGHDDIVNAFKRAEPRIETCNCAGDNGYIHIHGPRYPPEKRDPSMQKKKRCVNHCVVIEKGSAAIVFREELGKPLCGRLRPAKNKREDERGGSIGTSTGSFRYVLTRDNVLERGLAEFVNEVIDCCKKLRIW